jgi:hypothetical protein
MKRLLFLGTALSTLSLTLALQGQASTAASTAAVATAQSGAESASATAETHVSAELTSKLNSKSAQVGDQVAAKTTATAILPDGTKLPKGTKLMGRVTEVHAKSAGDNSAHLAFKLDRAVMRDGREVPVHAMVASLTAPSTAVASASDDLSADGISGGGGVSGSGGVRGGGLGGGLVGGTTHALGGTTRMVGQTAGGALRTTTSTGMSLASGAARLDQAPVGNLPGVTVTSSQSASNSGSLDAAGRNINLESGTQMSLALAAQP